MLYKVGDMIRLGDEWHMDNSNLPHEFAGKVVEICEVSSNKYWFYDDEYYDFIRPQRWYVYHGDCELYVPYDMPDKNDLLDFIGI